MPATDALLSACGLAFKPFVLCPVVVAAAVAAVCVCACMRACVSFRIGGMSGLLVDPLKACVHLYVNQKRVPTSMPLSEAAKTALSDPQARVIFCVDLDNREQAVCITNHQIPA